ncbi:hypothetical protein BEI46_08590 [Aliivibrio fischeri]|uniref:hypothetical protein n=1 Tax=Aliivibrio fischeri TaxID=668 RepID=UPI00084C0792|nr:hypothetical protein [Aliivibrio fischeri]OED56337.1 hypothetical protein BEI46_08590 [Aliivibrio fischeri]
MKVCIGRFKSSFSSFAFYWFLSIYPFIVLLNSFDYLNIYGVYLFNILICFLIVSNQVFSILKSKVSYVAISITISLCLIVLILFLSGYDKFGSLDNGVSKSVLNYFLPFIINSFGLFVLGYQVNIRKILLSKANLILLLPAIFILCHVKGFRLDYSLLKDPSLIGIYLIVGDALCFSAVFFCLRKDLNFSSFIMMLFFLVVLYLNNSRASFFVFSIIFIFTVWYFYLFKNTLGLIISSIAFLLLIILFSDKVIDILSLNERMALVLSGGTDYSSNARSLLLSSGIDSIVNNWFIGDLGGQIDTSGRLGGYIHNILSYWRQFGLAVFLCLFIPIIYLIFYMFNMVSKVKKEYETEYLISLMCISIASAMIFFARSIPYYLLFFALGLADNFRLTYISNNKE